MPLFLPSPLLGETLVAALALNCSPYNRDPTTVVSANQQAALTVSAAGYTESLANACSLTVGSLLVKTLLQVLRGLPQPGYEESGELEAASRRGPEAMLRQPNPGEEALGRPAHGPESGIAP